KDVAAIIVEPIQGTAGNIVPPPGYLKLLRDLADQLGALLICDEMITGFGRTGKMFAIEHEGVLPDILTVGKGFGGGFPMSGVIAREEIAFSKPWANPSGSSSSYGGNPLAAAAAHVTIQTIMEEGLVEHARRLGAKMLAEMKRWESELPIVSDVRGRGLLLGMDLVVPGTRKLLDKKTARWIFDTLLSRGVLAMIYNPEVRINPPLVIEEEQAMGALATMKDVLGGAAERLIAYGASRRGGGRSPLIPPHPHSHRAGAGAHRCLRGPGHAVVAGDRRCRRPSVRLSRPLDEPHRGCAVHRLGHLRFGRWTARAVARLVDPAGSRARWRERQPSVHQPLLSSYLPAGPQRLLVAGRISARGSRRAGPYVPECGGRLAAQFFSVERALKPARAGPAGGPRPASADDVPGEVRRTGLPRLRPAPIAAVPPLGQARSPA